MTISENLASQTIADAKSRAKPLSDLPPISYLPPGDSVLRVYVKEVSATRLEMLREQWAVNYKNIGQFDGNDPFVQAITRRAADACARLPKEKRWDWQWKPRRSGVVKGVFYELSDQADLQYVGTGTARIIILNNTALNAWHDFIAAQSIDTIREQFDNDAECMGIRFSLKTGSGATCNVGWDLAKRALPNPFTWGEGKEFPSLDTCWVHPGYGPNPEQQSKINELLAQKINQENLKANTISPSA